MMRRVLPPRTASRWPLPTATGHRSVSPGDDEILAAVARGESTGDLEVVFWDDHDELLAKLRSQMAENLEIRDDDYKSFNRSLGIDREDWVGSEAWQILSPTRAQHFGTDDLNRLIRRSTRAGSSPRRRNRTPGPHAPSGIRRSMVAGL